MDQIEPLRLSPTSRYITNGYIVYSQAWRGRERRQGILPKAPTEEKATMKDRSSFSRHRRQLWAVLLKKVWDVDALRCPKCGGQMKVISIIE